MTDGEHRAVLYQPNRGRYPNAWRAYCTKAGCGWTWDGIGRYEHFRDLHEQLNAAPQEADNHHRVTDER
jgi:hypothetical protein